MEFKKLEINERSLLVASKVRFIVLMSRFEKIGDMKGVSMAESYASEIEDYLDKSYIENKNKEK